MSDETQNQKSETPTLSITDVANDLGVSRATVLRWVRAGKLQRFFRIGKKFLVRREDYEQFIKGRINTHEII
jgi:excisionase family DNA binding protein